MAKTFIGPKLRQLRRERNQTQAEMAKALGVSASYVNLLENNQRSLSVQLLMAISASYGVDWQDLTQDDTARVVTDLRSAIMDPLFGEKKPDLQELRSAADHAPVLAEQFLHLYQSHRSALEKIMQLGKTTAGDALLESSPEAVIYDFFRNHSNHFPVLERLALASGAADAALENHFEIMRQHLKSKHGVDVKMLPISEETDALRNFDEGKREILLSQALDHVNRVFQLAHMIALIEHGDVLDDLVKSSSITSSAGRDRLRVELANYYAAAYLMPYDAFLKEAERSRYNIDRMAAAFGVSFEQAAHRLTTLQRDGARGIPFFLLRIDKAGNVTKRFNSTSFPLAEHGGACPVWNIHEAFYTPDSIIKQFVETPDGERFFTISRTVHRPLLADGAQDHRLTVALGCALKHVDALGYADGFKFDGDGMFSRIGINCHLCPRQACSQRAHQSLFVELPIDPNSRGYTRYES